VLYILDRFPQLSETYIKVEIEALRGDYDLRIVSLRPADLPYRNHHPFEHVTSKQQLDAIVREFRPEVLHTHYVTTLPFVSQVAAAFDIPYTVRSHSFDVIGMRSRVALNELCLGVLAFPFARTAIEAAGIPSAKVIDCWPVVDVARFHDPAPNGAAILNVGAALPKKRFEDFIDLAARMPGRTFDLYSIGYLSPQLAGYNTARGAPAAIHAAVQPEEMPRVYKAHGWLVYTACPRLRTVGWPMSVAEAQAAGLGICMPRLRPDLDEYVGGAGFLYDSIDEVPAILERPYPEEMRQRGFEHARRSDIRTHRSKLTALWDAA
jgi:glycosyltransferase involved in cell wall biosynthesis